MIAIRKITWIIALSFLLFSCSKESGQGPDEKEPEDEQPQESYDDLVLSKKPSGYWLASYGDASDLSGKKHDGEFKGPKTESTTLPNGDGANVFDGEAAYLEIPDADHLELTTTGELTIEAWMRPDVEDFPNVEKDKDYIHWMGKGTPGQHSWVARMYNKDSWREDRPQRISGYAFNLSGGLGAGSYFQDHIKPGTWVHYVLVINTNNTSSAYPTGYTIIYRDGEKRQQRNLKDYDIIPGNGTAPIRIATRDLGSFFLGAIGKVAIYDYELSAEQLKENYLKMVN